MSMDNTNQIMGERAGYADVLTGPEAFLNEVMATDALSPAQLYSRRRDNAAKEPWRRLMMAVLIDAIRSYQRNFDAVTLRKRREFREAQYWLFKDRNDGPFSFDTVSYALDTDPELLRLRLIQFQHSRAAASVRRARVIHRRRV